MIKCPTTQPAGESKVMKYHGMSIHVAVAINGESPKMDGLYKIKS